MTDVRCKKCNRLLMKAINFQGEIKCPKCGHVNSFLVFNKKESRDSETDQVA